MSKRSPILGFNHNVRHRGVVFHVQTEDSGVDNPHLFSHVFAGGVILSTRKMDYDRDAAEDVVKGLMQSQHKALLKELRAGSFDEKIDRYLVDNPDLEPASPRAGTPSMAPSIEAPTTDPVVAALEQEVTAPTAEDPAVATPEPGRILVEENSEVTISIELPAKQAAAQHDTVETPILGSPVPPAPSPHPASRTIGLGSAVLGAARAQATPPPVPIKPPTVKPAPAQVQTQAAAAPPAAAPAANRPGPGAVEFRAPNSEVQAQAARPAPPTKVEFRKPTKATESELSAAFRAIRVAEKDVAPIAPPASIAPAVPPPESARTTEPNVYIHTRSGRHSVVDDIEAPPTSRPERVHVGASAVPAAAPASQTGRWRRDAATPSVTMSRPSVIVGAPPKMIGHPEAAGDPRARQRKPNETGKPALFGKELVSEKSLDEVILAYLSDDGEEKK